MAYLRINHGYYSSRLTTQKIRYCGQSTYFIQVENFSSQIQIKFGIYYKHEEMAA